MILDTSCTGKLTKILEYVNIVYCCKGIKGTGSLVIVEKKKKKSYLQ